MSKQNEKPVSGVIKGRIFYAKIFEPEAPYNDEKGAPIYSFTLLIPKSDTQTINLINELVKNAEENALNNNLISLANLKSDQYRRPLRDGNTKADDRPEFKDMYFINVKRNVFYENDKKTEVKARICVKVGDNTYRDATVKDIYNGCWVEAYLTFYTYNKVGYGTSATYSAILKHHDDEKLSWTAQPEVLFSNSSAQVYTEDNTINDWQTNDVKETDDLPF